jgi:AcrR family transcriptional regulator
MARNRKPTPTRAVIIKAATELFFEKGFSRTTSTEVSKKAEISTGNLTFYFPTKEHILAVLTEMMCDFQWREMQALTDEGNTSLLAYCLELTMMVAISDEIPEMHDFLTAAYKHSMTLDFIRQNDTEKIKRVFAEYTNNWSDEHLTEIEDLISGIEYATLMRTEHSASVEYRIKGALNTVMSLFGVPEQVRQIKIAKVLSMDYRAIGRRVYEEFKEYVTRTNEQALDEVLKYTKVKTYK